MRGPELQVWESCCGSEPQSFAEFRADHLRLLPGLKSRKIGEGVFEAHPQIQSSTSVRQNWGTHLRFYMSASLYDTPAGQALQGTGSKPSIPGYSSGEEWGLDRGLVGIEVTTQASHTYTLGGNNHIF